MPLCDLQRKSREGCFSEKSLAPCHPLALPAWESFNVMSANVACKLHSPSYTSWYCKGTAQTPSFLFPLTFPVKLLLVRSETQWPWPEGNWKMGLFGRYDSKVLLRTQMSSPGDYRVSNTKISVSSCHQARTGRNFTWCDESAAVWALCLKKCSDSINVPSFILLPPPPFSRKPISFLLLLPCSLLLPSPWASIMEPFSSCVSDS